MEQKLRSGSITLVLIAMEEVNALCWRPYWCWKDLIIIQEKELKERKPWQQLSSGSVFSNFPRKSLRVLCGYFEHQRRVQCDRCVEEPLQTIVTILPWSKWSCLLMRVLLQEALSEVTHIHPPLKLRVFVDDITAFMNGRNKELMEMAEKVLKNVKRELEEKGLKLSITEGGKEGKSKAMTSCRYLEERFQECSREDGVALATSVERWEWT